MTTTHHILQSKNTLRKLGHAYAYNTSYVKESINKEEHNPFGT